MNSKINPVLLQNYISYFTPFLRVIKYIIFYPQNGVDILKSNFKLDFKGNKIVLLFYFPSVKEVLFISKF